jgi:hypothetical protein
MFVATAAACVRTFGDAFGACRPVGAAAVGLLAIGCGASEEPARTAFATAVGVGDVGELLGADSPAVRAVCGLAVSCLRVATVPAVGVVAAGLTAVFAVAVGLAAAVAFVETALAGARAACRASAVGAGAVGELAAGAFACSRRMVDAGVALAVVGVEGASMAADGAAAAKFVAFAARGAGALRGCGWVAAAARGVGWGVSIGAVVATSTRVVVRGR